ncbi:hypothetical protein VNO77_26965 [Canavalia gladiata]|uniref:Reverse transcriptase zinc-binding domain-containing protein n=1 Tax=Canavalia gladiata TaxID=3824 RepID=A0AAN9KT70_CANGL
MALKQIWKATTSKKVTTFGWKLLQDRILTSHKEGTPNIYPMHTTCNTEIETSYHLFLKCQKALDLWKKKKQMLHLPDMGVSGIDHMDKEERLHIQEKEMENDGVIGLS